MSPVTDGLAESINAPIEAVRAATVALTSAAERIDPEGVTEAIEARGQALDELGAWFASRSDDETRALHRRLTGEFEASLVEARAALARMRDSAKHALDTVREARVVRGYSAGGEATRKSASLDRAG